MAKRKTPVAVEDKRISRSIKKTPKCKTNPDGKPCCPKCGVVPTDSESYEEGKNKGEIVFYYRCKECGQTFRRVINVKDI